jgi:hypothetical protein
MNLKTLKIEPPEEIPLPSLLLAKSSFPKIQVFWDVML